MKTMPSRDEIDRAIAARQTHCYTCGNKLTGEAFECYVCHEWQCSKECLEKHSKTMNEM